MRKYILTLLAVLTSIIIFNSCSDQTQPENVKSELISRSDCKQDVSKEEITDSMSCIKYDYSDNILTIDHINAGFNCCPGSISCSNVVKNDTIIVTEKEESALCDCNCLFDLKIQISGLENKKYFIKFEEPYRENQEELSFELDLSNQTNGTHCVERLKYPWGL